MIYLICSRGEDNTIGRFIRATPDVRSTIRVVTYDALASNTTAPVGHYIFTDHDRLTPEALEWAAGFAKAAVSADPAVRILNHPLHVLERYGLVRALVRLGLGGFDMVRLDEGRVPKFPAFIRCESGTGRPETTLLDNEAEYIAALDALTAAGKTRKGRVAVEFADVRGPDGRYRKYGAVRVGDRIIPQHLFVADDWCVKMDDAKFNTESVAEELAFVTSPPHPDLMRAFDAAGMQYGRIDFGMVNGRPVVFEINTNPSLPRPGGGDIRAVRREQVCKGIASALIALDVPLARAGVFGLPPALHRPTSVARMGRWFRESAIRTSMADKYFRWRRNRRYPPAEAAKGSGTV